MHILNTNTHIYIYIFLYVLKEVVFVAYVNVNLHVTNSERLDGANRHR
jgi:hypothetical protein